MHWPTRESVCLFSSPFQSATDALKLEACYLVRDEYQSIKDRDVLSAGRALLTENAASRCHLRTIFRWKLESFLRYPQNRDWPSGISEQSIQDAVSVARNVRGDDDISITGALTALDALPYVGIPVASAILMAMHPDQFTVTDKQAYKALACGDAKPVTGAAAIREYLSYLHFCRSEAHRLGIGLRQLDRALWQCGAFQTAGKRSSLG